MIVTLVVQPCPVIELKKTDDYEVVDELKDCTTSENNKLVEEVNNSTRNKDIGLSRELENSSTSDDNKPVEEVNNNTRNEDSRPEVKDSTTESDQLMNRSELDCSTNEVLKSCRNNNKAFEKEDYNKCECTEERTEDDCIEDSVVTTQNDGKESKDTNEVDVNIDHSDHTYPTIKQKTIGKFTI